MTYVGMMKNKGFQTLVLAESDEEARAKVFRKFSDWWNGDYREEDMMICAFGDGHRV